MFPLHLNLNGHILPFYEGAYFAISFLTGYILILRAVKNARMDEEQFSGMFLAIVLSAIAGGRLFHIIFWNPYYYLDNPVKLFYIWEGGITVIGGIVGGIIAGAVYCRITHTDFFAWCKVALPAVAFSQGVGRIGCFLNGDAFGLPTTMPWGMEFPKFGRTLFDFKVNTDWASPGWQWAYEHGLVSASSTKTPPMHPTQLYESIFDIVLALVLLRVNRKDESGKTTALIYVAGYSIARGLLEFIRGDRELVYVLNMSLMQMVLFATGTAALTALVLLRFAPRKEIAESVKPQPTKRRR